MVKPNYLVIGAAKSGTTTLCNLLGQHPEVYMFPHKETHFFSLYFERGIEWYKSKFNPPREAKAIGEGSPTYSEGNHEVVKRIAQYLPDAKLIYIVRNPIQRIESDFVQLLDNGQRFDSLESAIKQWKPLVESSRYWARINDFRQYFSDDKILVLFMEDLTSDPKFVLKRCFEFLGVDPSFEIETDKPALNSRASKQVDYPWMTWLRKQKFFLDTKWLLPTRMTQALKPLFRKPLAVNIQWNDETRQKVISLLKEDTSQFLCFYGKSTEYWELS
jgi:hypothetical protein